MKRSVLSPGKKTSSLPLIFIFFSLNCFSSVDSTRQHLAGMKDDTSKVKALNDQCRSLLNKGNYEEAFRYGYEADSLAIHLGYKSGEGSALNNLGVICKEKGDYEKALNFHGQALKIRLEINDKKGIAGSYNNIGEVYRLHGEFDKALDYYLRSLKLKEALGDKNGMASVYNNIGLLYQDQNNYAKALENQLKGLEIKRNLGDKPGIALASFNIGGMYLRQRMYGKSISMTLEALRIEDETGDKKGVANCFNNLGLAYLGLGDSLPEGDVRGREIYSKALAQLKDALRLMTQLGDKEGEAVNLINISGIYERTGNAKEAIINANAALTLARSIGARPRVLECYAALARAYKRTGDFKNALQYGEDHAALHDSLLNEENEKHMNEMNVRYESEKKDRDLSTARLELKKEEAESSRNAVLRDAFIAGFLLVLALAFFIYRNFLQNKRYSTEIESKNHELERLSIVASETENTILIMDANGVLEWVNESFVKLNAITLEELKALKGETIFEVSNNPRIRAIVDESIRDKKPVTYESFNRTRDGKEVWESSTLTPIFDAGGTLRKLIIIDTDITGMKHAEELIREKNNDILASINYAKRIQSALLPRDKFIQRNLERLKAKPKKQNPPPIE